MSLLPPLPKWARRILTCGYSIAGILMLFGYTLDKEMLRIPITDATPLGWALCLTGVSLAVGTMLLHLHVKLEALDEEVKRTKGGV